LAAGPDEDGIPRGVTTVIILITMPMRDEVCLRPACRHHLNDPSEPV
jgi:hypothetical protein